MSASDKSTGRENKITINNDKGRLSKEEIDRMVQEAERYRQEDEAQKERISAKNALESYLFNMKNTIEEPAMQGKIGDDEKRNMLSKIQETLNWLEANQLASKQEFEHKQKEVEQLCNPVIQRLYQSMPGAGAPPGPQPGGSGGRAKGPTIEEVD